MRATDTTSAERARRPGFRAVVGLVSLLVVVAGLSVAVADPAPAANSRGSKVLARLQIKSPNVEIMKKGTTAFVAAKNNQVLRQGDALRTDTVGLAEVAYTDGSLTRLGPSTEFAISRLSSKKGARQTQGTLTVGSTWNRAAKVSESGSFEVKAGGATAAVEGTTFAVICTQGASGVSCEFLDITDPITVTTSDGNEVQMTDATSVVVDPAGEPGQVQTLTYDQLAGNAFIAGNLLLDQQAGIGRGLTELGPPPSTTTTTAPPPPAATETTDPPPTTQAPPSATEDPSITVGGDLAAIQYPPDGTIVVDDVVVQPGGEVSFSGGGCLPNEPLEVLFDGKQIGSIVSDAEGNFTGTLHIPQGTRPGDHLLTVRGSGCELNAVITVGGRGLAFTGSSDNTSTLVLVGVAAVVVGLVLVVGARRRRNRLGGSRAGPSTA